MAIREDWEFRFKACSAITAVFSAASIVIGGAAAPYTYRQQGLAAEQLKQKELRQAVYNQKREIYYDLVDAAAAASASVDKPMPNETPPATGVSTSARRTLR